MGKSAIFLCFVPLVAIVILSGCTSSQSTAGAAKDDLAGIEKGSDLPMKSRYNRLNIYLAEFIGRMQDNLVQQKTVETVLRSQISDRSPGDRFPRRSP